MHVPPCTGPHTQETKDAISVANRKSWAKDEDRREKLIEWNKTVHSQTMKEMWSKDDHPWKDRKVSGRPKGAKDLTQRKKRPERTIVHGDKTYATAKEAAEFYGIHPVNIRRKCRMEKYKDWKYA